MGMAFYLEPAEKFAERYVVERLLGEGNRKRTYLARDMKVDRLVALSLVKPESVRSDAEGTAREARVLGRLGSHDNIVSPYDYDIGSTRRRESVSKITTWRDGGGIAAAFDYMDTGEGGRGTGRVAAPVCPTCNGHSTSARRRP